MHFSGNKAMFENRYDAGRQLSEKLMDYKNKHVLVLAIPNGGVPIALGVAIALEADFNLVISRKVPLPLSPEGGFGAVTDDGTVILNEELVKKMSLSQQQVNYQINKARATIRQRSLLYYKDLPPSPMAGKTIVVVDDGLASGYTMMAAVKSLRTRRPREIIAAIPVASENAFKKVDKVANKVVACAVDPSPKFFVADYYRYWNEPADDEVLQCFKEWRLRRSPSIQTRTQNLP